MADFAIILDNDETFVILLMVIACPILIILLALGWKHLLKFTAKFIRYVREREQMEKGLSARKHAERLNGKAHHSPHLKQHHSGTDQG